MSEATRREKRLPMVCWYDPRQLLQTAVGVVISSIFGRHADRRLIEAVTMMGDPPEAVDYSDEAKESGEFWLDYASDVGDGWNSTYGVAHALSQEKLTLKDGSGNEHTTKRGRVLILGGDEVYPTPSRQAYEDRLVVPYSTALSSASPRPHLYAVPGNHDWYDSLVSFSRLFLSGRRIGAWQTKQRRSYFALRLPHGWWLLGIDVQLGSDVDVLQQRYFKEIAEKMEPQDRIILCTAEPEWIYERMYSEFDENFYSERTLRDFEERVLGGKDIQVMISGDLHHYRRHEQSTDSVFKRQRITAGGGGAFLHPTHGPDVKEVGKGRGTHKLKASYPDAETSRRLCWGNLLFPFRNPSFLWFSGLLYLLTAWAMKLKPDHIGPWQWNQAFWQTAQHLLASPPAAFWILAVLAGFLVFTDTHSNKYRLFAGLSHGVTHLIAVYLIGWSSAFASQDVLRSFAIPPGSRRAVILGEAIGPALGIFSIGSVVGAFLLGIYLLISLNIFRRHSNEAFSSLAIQDWKNFLRLRITAEGLTIFPVGIDRVPRKWKTEGNRVEPDDPQATAPRIIEPEPVTVF
jgi:hypothetical protein